MNFFKKWIIDYLMHEKPQASVPICDFNKLAHEIKNADVLLVEGRTRISDFTRIFTQSSWSHAVLYIGRLQDIGDLTLRQKVKDFYKGEPTEQLIIESLLGSGAIISPLAKYRMEHIRICRPDGISKEDADKVIAYVIKRLGYQYDVRQVLDLARFLLPLKFFPKKWHSTLFSEDSASTREICSSLIAEAFLSVQFPILPIIQKSPDQNIHLIKRNPKLYTPKDFDYSPFFQIIKYPIFTLSENTYHNLPWKDKGGNIS